MDSIYFTEEHNIFRKSLKDFVKKEIRPYAEEWEEAEVYPREIFKRMGDLGFLGVSYPEEYGGGVETISPLLFLPKRSPDAGPSVLP
jgi:alkylation response protein AidB-like acyl-CoA dehydrogenase